MVVPPTLYAAWWLPAISLNDNTATEEEKARFAARPDLERNNSSRSTYVWLPVTFTDGKPQICWYDSWRMEDFL